MMAEEEKPFKCYHHDCDMKFTNEDHLSVHLKKHDMSLALNLGSGLGGLSPMGLCDQTPTPTKFLKGCEELGLFQELSKNPFEDSFKKALDGSGDEPDTSDPSGIPGPGGMLNLDTPLPSNIQIPKIINEHVDDIDVKSPTKGGPLSSIVPKKREKYLSSHVYPTSTTSEDDEGPTPTSTNTEQDTKSMADSVDDILGDSSEVLAVSSTKMEHTLVDSVDDMLADAADLIATSSTKIQSVVGSSTPSYTVVKNHTPARSSTEIPPVIESTTPSYTIVTNHTPAVTSLSKPAVVPSHVTMQALLQLPNGQTIPIQLPGSIVAQPQTQVVPVQSGSPPKSTSVVPQKNVTRIVQGNTQFIQTIPHVVQQRPVIQGVVQTVPGATHNLPVGLVQNQGTRAVPLQTVKLGPNPLTQTVQTVPVQQTGNQSVLATVISPDKQTVTQTNTGVKTVIAPQIVVQSAQKRSAAVSPKPQTQSSSKTSPNQGSQPYTKQRLKAALTSNINPSSTMKINHIFKMVEETRMEQQQQQQQSQDAMSVASTSETLSSPDETPFPVKQAKFDFPQADGEDSEDKRRKFLERNRAAAARCRQKRKSWIYNLESKAEELTNVNNKLQKEITSLRGEVAHLKKLLIAHKDCPVTLQQKSTGQILSQQPMQQEESSQSSESMDMEPIEIVPAINGDIPANHTVPNVPVIAVDPLGVPLGASTASVPMATAVLTGPNSIDLTMNPQGGPLVGSTSSVPMVTGVLPSPATGVLMESDSVPMVTSVLTGPNTVAMIPTIVNLDLYTKQEPT